MRNARKKLGQLAVVVKTQQTPGEHQDGWQMEVHPPKNGVAIGYAPWPTDSWVGPFKGPSISICMNEPPGDCRPHELIDVWLNQRRMSRLRSARLLSDLPSDRKRQERGKPLPSLTRLFAVRLLSRRKKREKDRGNPAAPKPRHLRAAWWR